MFQDLRERADGDIVDTDIAIAGAGAAGITTARELIGSGRKVLLIESGGFAPEAETQALNDGEIAGEPYSPLNEARLRCFGGTTHLWGGQCRPLDTIDFEARSWLPYSGWPLTRRNLEPYYRRAHEICELGPYLYDAEAWRAAVPALLDLDPSKWVNRLLHFSPPTQFGNAYRRELQDASNVTALLNANLVELILNGSAKAVTELKLKSLDGKTMIVRPKVAVLACGGIENARLLLASNKIMTSGIGNMNDLVGRFFMEHPNALIAYGVPLTDIKRYAAYFSTEGMRVRIPAGEAAIRVKLALAEDFQQAQRLRNAAIDVGWGHSRSEGYLALKRIFRSFERGEMPNRPSETFLTTMSDMRGIAAGLYGQLRGRGYLWFGANVEQEPNPASRVTLDRERDALASPKPRLEWRLTDGDKEAVRTTISLLGKELARLGVARTHIDGWLLKEDPHWEELDIRYHHMGTTRMSDDPKAGVVDRHGRVHGIANLYVAGSSVFPTSGYANPMLTIVALAVRLADHLKVKFAHETPAHRRLEHQL